jgi:hypothetical protein
MGSKLHVDPGLIHHRKIEALLGESGSNVVSDLITRIPLSTPEWRKEVLVDQIYSRVLIDATGIWKIKTLEQLLAEQSGHLFCSIVRLRACPEIYESERVAAVCCHSYGASYRVELHFASSRVRADTLRSRLSMGGEFAVVGLLAGKRASTLIFDALLIGFPYLHDTETDDLQWRLYTDHYRLHLEDFREFADVGSTPLPETFTEMSQVSETVFKRCLGTILRESLPLDWGGEASDFFTSHLHVGDQRVTAAFLLKGPGNKFSPMTLRHLGKNGDQIVRLSKEPADVLVVQHCHDIQPSVQETLKLFATQPGNPKRYCLIDGRESLRLLQAFGLAEWATRETSKTRRKRW